MVRMLGFSEEDKERIGVAQQGGGGKGVVRGVLGLPGRFVGGILGGKSAGSHANVAASDNQVKTPSSLIQRMSTRSKFFHGEILFFWIFVSAVFCGFMGGFLTQRRRRARKKRSRRGSSSNQSQTRFGEDKTRRIFVV